MNTILVASTIGTSPSSENGRVDFCSLVGEDDSREGTHDIIDDNALFGQQLIDLWAVGGSFHLF